MNSSGVSSVDIDDDDDGDVDGSTWYCVDCGASSPKTRTAHTLISSKHGWRLARIPDDKGGYRFEWRCPGCWTAFKQQGSSGPTSTPRPFSTPPRPAAGAPPRPGIDIPARPNKG